MKLSFTVNYEPHWGELIRMNKYRLAVLGNQPSLGDWDIQKVDVQVLKTTDYKTWSFETADEPVEFPIDYKYILFNPENESVIEWESRDNREILENLSENENLNISDNDLYFDVQVFKGAGVAIPIFSLRSEEGFGVGEFFDLKKMIDWTKLTGQRIIQTLPVNDTTLQRNKADSYPYNTLSVFALHPMYLRLEAVGLLKDKQKRAFFKEQKLLLNQLQVVDYEKVNQLKWEYLKLIFKQEKNTILSKKVFKSFIENNKSWLYPYALFSVLRDRYKTAEFSQWKEGGIYSEELINKLNKQDVESFNFYLYIQYHLDKQLAEVKEYAHSNGVLLKGDIPIGVSPHSVDVWCQPYLFNRNVQAGAPPDDFSEMGQNWGFPTYNWEIMAKDDYAWWKARLQHMSNYFDAYRIDHILGFFRIWEIPIHAKWGLLGQFNKAKPLSEEDVESYGFVFEEDKLLKPQISYKLLRVYFGDLAAEVKAGFLMQNEKGEYILNPKFDTQRKVISFFSSKKEISANDRIIQEGLLKLLCQVLFVRDSKNAHCYHPRISYHNNDAFKLLSTIEKEEYIRLYEDFFYRRHDEFWKQQAFKKLSPILTATSMLAFGEDLGMIPNCVPEVMRELNLLSLEIQRMPKQFGQEFGVCYFAPYLSLSTTSTHDMNPIRAWWGEDKEKTQRYFNSMLFESGEAPENCEAWIVEKIIAQHIQSPAIWTILPLQDILGMDTELRHPDALAERINVPDNSKNVWCYRMYLTVDKLINAVEFNAKLKEMIESERI